MNDQKITLDVREDIRNGREPCSKIMNAAAALQANEQLLLIAPFEPVPLFGVLEKRGFKHDARPIASGDWEVLFTRQPDAPPAETAPRVAFLNVAQSTTGLQEVFAKK